MREIIELDKGWQYSCSHGGNETEAFGNTSAEAQFPICDSSPQAQHILRTSIVIPSDYSDGSVYLCLADFWGDGELYIDKKLRCAKKSAGGNVYFDISGLIYRGTEAFITLIAASNCGYFALSHVSLIFKNKSHFYPVDGTSCGITVSSEKKPGGARVHVVQKVINPINYDIASYIITDAGGCVLGSAASKPSQSEVIIDIPDSRFWNGPHDAGFLILTASILRDSTVLDVVQLRFGLHFSEVQGDGFFYLNGVRMPISGMSVSLRQLESVPVKKLTALADELGANAFALTASPVSIPLISECDRLGFAVWLNIPSNIRGEEYIACLRRFSEHPSVVFIGTESFEENSAAMTRGNTVSVDRQGPAYAYVENSADAALFASKITKNAPAAVFVSNNDTESHEKIWSMLCSRSGLFAFFVEGLFSAEQGDAPGIEGYEQTDAFYFYKSCFSSVPFVKIIPCEPQGKYADIKCCSNEASLSLTVNGKARKKYTATLSKGGLVVFCSVFLPSKENIVRVKGEKSSDETEIIIKRRNK